MILEIGVGSGDGIPGGIGVNTDTGKRGQAGEMEQVSLPNQKREENWYQGRTYTTWARIMEGHKNTWLRILLC